MAIPAGWERLGFTSGRRTHRGNKLVGGVPNSDHLSGTAGDFTASVAALREFFGPNVRILDEGDHRHVAGLTDVPFHGRQGIAGLVNGIDTTAPRREAKQMIGASPYPLTPGQPDPLAPLQSPLPPVMQPQSSLAAFMQQPAPPPQAPEPRKVKPGTAIVGILADALAGAFGNRGGFAPAFASQQQQQMEDERQLQQWREKVAAERAERMRPRLEQVGSSIVSIDPSTNQVTPIYQQDQQPERTALENNLALLKKLRPDLSDEDAFEIAKAAISGSERGPRIITYSQGGETVTEQVNPDGSRSPIARAPRWQPKPPAAGGAKLPPGFILD